MKSNIFNWLIEAVRYRFNLDEDKASEADVIENIRKSVEFKGINVWTLVFAIFIASIGLNVNSTAVIIGAMLISPLMGPIMGIGLGAGIFDFELIKKAVKNLLIATVIGLCTSTIYFLLSPLRQAQSELLARTTPTIYDVLIAFFGGLAGIVASSRKKYNNVIPGVAIATALMPPLCTAGFGLATWQPAYFAGAFYLFLINSVFISISTFLIVRFLKYNAVSYVNVETAKKMKNWIGAIAVLTIIPSLFLAYHFINNEIFEQNANRFITEQVLYRNYALLNKRIIPEDNQIVLTTTDAKSLDSLRTLVALSKERYGLQKANIILKTGITENKEPDLNQLKEGIIQDIYTKQELKLNETMRQISDLRQVIDTQNEFSKKRNEAVNEFYALFGQPKELLIERSVNYTKSGNDTILVVYVKSSSAEFDHEKLHNIQEWLKTRFSINQVKIVKED